MKIYILLLSLLIFHVNNLLCGEEDIEHCLECDEGKHACKKCESNYFPFLENVLCLPCDHYLYGKIGCGRDCEATDYINYLDGKPANCLPNGCLDGYYNKDNWCYSCTYNCAKCTYDSITDSSNCNECISNEYKLNTRGSCDHCYSYSDKCQKCHYDNGEKVCDKCRNGYYFNKAKKCTQCSIQSSEGKIFEVCSDEEPDMNSLPFICSTHYTKVEESNKCEKCPNNCYGCEYDSLTKQIKCYLCDDGYTLNSEGICISCGDNCDYCDLDNNGKPVCYSCKSDFYLNENNECVSSSLICASTCSNCIDVLENRKECSSCFFGYTLMPDKTCVKCPENCDNCFWKEDKGEFGCSACSFPFDFDNLLIVGKDDKCVSCKNAEEIGFEGCESCIYDKQKDEYLCLMCSDEYILTDKNRCISKSICAQDYPNDCMMPIYNSTIQKCECYYCNIGYILIVNERRCLDNSLSGLSSMCREANNTGTTENPNYSCISCSSNYIKVNVTQNQIDCELPSNGLSECIEAIKDKNGKTQCLKCIKDFKLIDDNNQMICSNDCDDDSFLKDDWCRKCDDMIYGNPGCLSDNGCYIDKTNDKFVCNKCKDGFFESSPGNCSHCASINIGCKKCIGTNSKDFKCEECIEGYKLNNSRCELIKCEEHPEITPGCLVCNDKLEEYKKQSKCESCKKGFFKTKDGSCVYCRARKNGGPGCEQCEYAKDLNGKDTDEIKCSYCPEGGVLNKDGKCLNCQEELGHRCTKCNYTLDKENNIEKLKCLTCSGIISSNGFCNQRGYQNTHCEYFDKNGKCIKLNIEDCTFSSIMSGYNKNSYCESFCSDTAHHTMIYYYINITKETYIKPNRIRYITSKKSDTLYNFINSISINSMYNILYKSDVLKSIDKNAFMCLGNLGTGDKYNPINLK